MIALYARISKVGMDESRQVENLKRVVGDSPHKLFVDKISGTIPFEDRPQGAKLMKMARDGNVDSVEFWEVSRCGRNIADVTATLYELADLGVQVSIRKEGITLLHPETRKINPTAALILSVLTSVSMIENQQRIERIREALAVRFIKFGAVGLGRPKGKVPVQEFLAQPRVKKIQKVLADTNNVSHTARITNSSRKLVRKVRDLQALQLETR